MISVMYIDGLVWQYMAMSIDGKILAVFLGRGNVSTPLFMVPVLLSHFKYE